jgi:hypothetical protein
VAPVGAWFSQVGRLHQVHHLWQYKYGCYVAEYRRPGADAAAYRSLDARKETREEAWQIDGWAETVSKVNAGH